MLIFRQSFPLCSQKYFGLLLPLSCSLPLSTVCGSRLALSATTALLRWKGSTSYVQNQPSSQSAVVNNCVGSLHLPSSFSHRTHLATEAVTLSFPPGLQSSLWHAGGAAPHPHRVEHCSLNPLLAKVCCCVSAKLQLAKGKRRPFRGAVVVPVLLLTAPLVLPHKLDLLELLGKASRG